MKKSRPILWLLIIAAAASAGYYGWHKYGSPGAAKSQSAQKGPPRAPAVPVSVSPVQKVDFPVYLTGLGTVQGFNTVQVRSRVDGQIDKIAFAEGQIAKEGEAPGLDRSPPLSSHAGPGQGQEGAGRGEPRQCQSRASSAP